MLKEYFAKWVNPPLFVDKKWLDGTQFFVADVGATGGPDPRWKSMASYVHFYLFDPNPAYVPASPKWNQTVFPIGLWSEKGQKKLHLMQNPEASSLFPIHEDMKVFANWTCHAQLGETSIMVDQLDSILENVSPPDFLKIDAEGADYEILKGANLLLKNSILGVQIESSFAVRHVGSVLFGEIDTYLKNLGYQLFDLQIECWLRKNQTFSSFSKPQIIWGDCLYILSLDSFVQKLSKITESKRQSLVIKYFTILMAYSLHDTAEELRLELRAAGLVNENTYIQMGLQIKKTLLADRGRGIKLLLVLLLTFGMVIVYSPFRKIRGQATIYYKAVLFALSKWLNSKSMTFNSLRR